MSIVKTPAQKAWDTRRANSGSVSPVNSANQNERNPDIDLVMQVAFGLSEGLAEIACSFVFMNKNKVAELSALSLEDRALLSIKLVTHVSNADSNAVFSGHEKTRVTISDGCAVNLESILPRMQALDSVLVTVFSDSEDTSFPMALQAIAWNVRVNWIEVDGKRSKRGIAYSLGEQACESVLSLYADKQESA